MFKWLKNIFSPKVSEVSHGSYKLPEPLDGGRELPEESFTGKLKLGVIVGHTKAHEGARMSEPFGLYEYSYNSLVAKAMKDCAPHNVEVEIILRDGKGITKSYDEARAKLCDCVIELHFNAANGQARGTETLCTPDMSDSEFAHIIHKGVAKLFERIGKLDRGVKTISKSARGGINVHSFPGGVNCLVEPFFGDNAEDAKMGMDNRVRYARCLVDAVVLWGKKVDLLK